ncbi:MAG: DPP IV N-terminal domain-containing protein [Bacteroidales bacterium]|nr:DPP IV N-terminal domain-containing protein [Bacteroidales bacterium]
MYRSFILVLLPLLLSLTVSAQSKLLTVEDASNMNPKLNPASLSQLQWRPGTSDFLFVAKNNLVVGNAESTGQDTLVRLSDMNTILKFSHQETLKRFPLITFLNKDQFYYTTGNKLFLCDLMKNSLTVVNTWNDKAENIDISTPGFKVAYTLDNNLYLSSEGKEIPLTTEKNKGILYGSSRVHRNEFGIEKGTFWSPRENYLAFYRMDESMVADYPLVDISTRIATLQPVKYPMAGMTSHKVTVCVYNISTSKTIVLQTDSTMEYLTNITWSPDEKYIYIACLNRDQNHLQLNKYDPRDGSLVKTLFEETSTAYVEPMHGPVFLNNDPTRFVWQSQRDGFNHLYLYNADGLLIRQLTKGPWVVLDFLKFDDQNKKAFFFCNKDNPLGRQLYMTDLKKEEVSPVTRAPGTHAAKVSDNGNYILDSYNSCTVPRQVEILDATGKSLQVLLSAENPLKEYKLGKTRLFTLKNEAHVDLYCRLIKPVDFDSNKRYPVIIYVYGGPHSQLVTDTWLGGGGLFLNYLADLGYVVFTLDNRGTSNRGAAFEQAIFRNLGRAEVSDQMVGLKYLKSLPYVDSTRVGLNGWSYGGFMTISLFLKNPGTFKVAVCGGPVIDWEYYEVMYGERYMDTPQSNPDGYKNACLLNDVKNLKGKLLIIHDYQDETVVPQNSLVFLKKCVDEGKQVDYFIYPGHEHNVRGIDRVHLNQKMTQYFQEYL